MRDYRRRIAARMIPDVRPIEPAHQQQPQVAAVGALGSASASISSRKRLVLIAQFEQPFATLPPSGGSTRIITCV